MWVLHMMGLTFSSIGVAHIVGGTIRVIVRVGSGSIYSNKLAPVHLQEIAENEKNQCMLLYECKDHDY